MEAAEARDIIDEAVERAEEAQERRDEREREGDKRFRDRAAILVGVFAVLLAVIHVAAESNARESLFRTVEASDTYAYMQAKIVRETVLRVGASEPGRDAASRAGMLDDAARLRRPDKAGHAIGQLQDEGERLRARSERAAARGERYELAETALQVAIVLLSIALVARSRPIAWGAVLLAGLGGVIALLTATGVI